MTSLFEWPAPLLVRARAIRLAAFDVDGTLTDGRLYFAADGSEMRCFHVADGLGLKLLQAAGIQIALITARRSPLVVARAHELGIDEVHQGVHDKGETLAALCTRLNIPLQATCFMGDDLPDLPALALCGLPAGPANAHPLLHSHLAWRAQARGGEGAVRELCDLLLDARGALPALLTGYASR